MTKKDIREVSKDLFQDYLRNRENYERPRIIAWHMYVGSKSGSAPFWRHGFLARFGRKLANGSDHTIIPDYDVIAQVVAGECPEWADKCDELWDFLLDPYEKRAKRKDFEDEAIEILSSDSRTNTGELDVVPF